MFLFVVFFKSCFSFSDFISCWLLNLLLVFAVLLFTEIELLLFLLLLFSTIILDLLRSSVISLLISLSSDFNNSVILSTIVLAALLFLTSSLFLFSEKFSVAC